MGIKKGDNAYFVVFPYKESPKVISRTITQAGVSRVRVERCWQDWRDGLFRKDFDPAEIDRTPEAAVERALSRQREEVKAAECRLLDGKARLEGIEALKDGLR